MIERFFTPGLAQVAYAIFDSDQRAAVLIDPRRDVSEYLDWLQARDLKLIGILETHIHADFVSGSRELQAATGAPIYASAYATANGEAPIGYSTQPLADGDLIAIGRLELKAVWTPGPTPEHFAFLLTDPQHGEEPIALFSGDVLFVGDVGRPDLLGEEQTERLSRQLFETVSRRLRALPDDVVVYPGHTAGSSCGKQIGDAPTTTIGQEKRFNYAFQPKIEEAFIATVMEGMPTPPPYYPVLKRVNRAGAPFLADLPTPSALTPAEVARQQKQGALVVDARRPNAVEAGHIPDAVAVGLGPDFVAWMGWLAPYDRDIVLVLSDDGDLDAAVTELHRIGLDRIGGYLQGGMTAWQASDRPVSTLATISVDELAAAIANQHALQVLDVRSDSEWDEGHIDGAQHLFAGAIAQGADVPFATNDRIAIICGSGYRSTVAASLLQARGFTNLVNVRGGMDAWESAGYATTSGEHVAA
jgi:hydroxyacylglutathione hydrolase